MTRRRFLRRGTDGSGDTDRIEEVLRTYRAQIADRLEEGLQEIQDRTTSLIRDIAIEVWASRAEQSDLAERVLAVLSRDATLSGLIAHTDERYQAIDLRLQGVAELAEDLRAALSRDIGPGRDRAEGLEPADARSLEERMVVLQRYLSAVLEYEAERDRTVAEWLQRLFARGQAALREEAGRVVGEVGADVDSLTEAAADRILARMEEQSRALSMDMAQQEARIRLSVSEGRDDQTALLRDQLRVLESIEADLTTELDERLSRLADLTGEATSRALDQVADRIGDRSAQAVTVGIKDILGVMDRRFAWLEETLHERLASLERALGIDRERDTTVLPEAEQIISIDSPLT